MYVKRGRRRVLGTRGGWRRRRRRRRRIRPPASARRHESPGELFTLKGGKCTRRYSRKPKRGIVHSTCIRGRHSRRSHLPPSGSVYDDLCPSGVCRGTPSETRQRGASHRSGLKIFTSHSSRLPPPPPEICNLAYLAGYSERGLARKRTRGETEAEG